MAYKVPFTTVLEVKDHPNADRLSINRVYGFWVVSGRDQYKVGDTVLFIPIDSILSPSVETSLFPPGSKITLTRSRVRQCRIRQFASQGMICLPETVGLSTDRLCLEEDYSDVLGIKKYDPPAPSVPGPAGGIKRNKPKENPRFHKYNGVENLKWCPDFFEGKEVVVQEKLHGSNCRAGIQPMVVDTLWKKVKRFLRLLPEYQYCYGSNEVQRQERQETTTYYGDDVYKSVLEKVGAQAKLRPGETIYGELIGPGIQKGYDYGHKEHHFVLFDVKVTDEDGNQLYLDPELAEEYAKERGFDFVPVLYRGPWDKDLVESLVGGPSVYCPEEKVREGVVIKTRTGYDGLNGKQAYKVINPKYLDDSSNTDFK